MTAVGILLLIVLNGPGAIAKPLVDSLLSPSEYDISIVVIVITRKTDNSCTTNSPQAQAHTRRFAS